MTNVEKRPVTLDIGGRPLEAAWWGEPSPDRAPLVLLHEGLGCVALWRDVPVRLAAATGRAVFAYSRFGYGQSATVPLPRPVSYMHDEAAEIVPRVLDAAGIGRAILVGHSDGGSIAAIHAAGPDRARVRGLVMIAAHFFVEDMNIRAIEAIGAEYRTSGLRARLARYHADVDAAFLGWNGAWLDPRFRAFDLRQDLTRITAPCLAIQGDGDPYGSDAQLRAVEELVPGPKRTSLIPGAGHAPHLETKDRTLAAIAAFANGLSG